MTWSCESNFRSNLSHFWEITRTRQVWTIVSGLDRDPAREKVPASSLGALKYDIRHATFVEDHEMSQLEIKDLHASIEGKEILKGVDFQVKQGEIHAIMGPNGSGKSTLASTIMGHPKYKVTKGDISFDGQTLLNLAPDARARKGVFLAFQYPYEVPGVSLSTFLRTAYNSVRQGGKREDLGQEMVSVLEFRKLLKEKLKLLDMDDSFATRYLNEGFSGGEKKRCEILN